MAQKEQKTLTYNNKLENKNPERQATAPIPVLIAKIYSKILVVLKAEKICGEAAAAAAELRKTPWKKWNLFERY